MGSGPRVDAPGTRPAGEGAECATDISTVAQLTVASAASEAKSAASRVRWPGVWATMGVPWGYAGFKAPVLVGRREGEMDCNRTRLLNSGVPESTEARVGVEDEVCDEESFFGSRGVQCFLTGKKTT